MSTRCRIGIENKDGTITSIYCHHDGYVENGVGEKLSVYYTDESKIRELMKLGDISSLGTEPVSNPDAWKMPQMASGSFEQLVKLCMDLHPDNMCDTYKTRGEDCPAKIHRDIKEYQKCSRDGWGEYTYLFKNGTWFVLEYDDEELKQVQDILDSLERYDEEEN